MTNATAFYVYDALCGWCYGFGPVIRQFALKYADRVPVEVLSGGMIQGSRIEPIAAMADYIRQASPRVAQTTGVTFGDAFYREILDKGTYISNSLPPAVALAILKQAKPLGQVTLAHDIQKQLYLEGRDLNEAETYLPLAAGAGISENDFRTKFNSEEYRTKAVQEFGLVQSWGISGFPAVVLQKEDQLYLVARGYQPYEEFTQTIDKVLAG